MLNRKLSLSFMSSRVFFLLMFLLASLLLVLHMTTSAAKDVENTSSSLQGPYGQPGRWELVFNDSFDSRTLDPNKWTTCYWWDNQGCTNEGNQNLNWYLPENVKVVDNTLQLTAREESVQASDGRSYAYTSGMVTTGRNVSDTGVPARFAFQYGYIEVRAKVPAGQGLWPALWLLPADQVSKPEIDIMEVLGHETDRVHMNFHYTDSDGERARSKGEWKGKDVSDGFHVYAVNWTPDRITWYIDGEEHRRYSNKTYIPSEPMYLLMNLAVGGEWPGSPDAVTPFPSRFEIDYVRVWKQSGDITLLPTSDTYVDASAPGENFGSERRLSVDGNPERVAVMKFDLKPLAGKGIKTVWLRIRTTGDGASGSENMQVIHLINDDWQENQLTYDDGLDMDNEIVGIINKTGANIAYDIPLDPHYIEIQSGKTLALAMTATGHDGMYIYSREFAPLSPQLIIQTTRGPLTFWEWWNQRFFGIKPE
jgi:beta-glucanase (GH16 family)